MADIYGGFDFLGAGNALSQMQSGRIAQENARLQQQYTMEDRAREDEARKLAAGAASAERLRKQQFIDTIKGGYMPAKTAVMGPGTVQGNTPASFDPEKVKNELLRRGDLSGLVAFSNAQEQLATQKKVEAEATGQGLTNEGIRATNTGTDFENTAKFIKMTNAQIDAAPDIASLKAIIAATFTPGHPMAKFNELNGLTREQSLAAIDGLIAKGYLFPQIREQISQGATKAADNIAARGLVAAQTGSAEATTAKTEAETANVGKPTTPSSTEKERAFAILAQGTVNPSIVNTPAYIAALAIASQSEIKAVTGPNGEVKYVSVAPSLPSWVVLPKENGAAQQTFAGAVAQRQASAPSAFTNALNQAGGAAPQVNNLATSAAAPATAPATVPAAAPAAAPADNRPDANVVAYRETDANGDVSGFNKYGVKITITENAGKPSAEVEKQRTANKRIAITVKELEDALKPGGLIEKATGSGIGAGRDIVLGFGGYTTEGAAAIAALKPIYDLVLKTVPRFEGPQSNADIVSYKDAAGRLADPLATLGEKQAAGKTILRLMKLYAGQFDILPDGAKGAKQPNSGATNTAVDETNPLFLLKPGAN